jgi:hypothetical protein
MKTNLYLLVSLMFVFTACSKNAEFTESNIITRNLEKLAKSHVQLDKILNRIITTTTDFDWEKFSTDLSNIENNEQLDVVLIKHGLQAVPNLKASLILFAQELSSFGRETDFAKLSAQKQKEYSTGYLAVYKQIIANEGVEASYKSFDECMDGCYYTGLENSLLCAAMCLGGTRACWVGVGCAIIRSNQLNRCYQNCRDAFSKE